MRRSLHISAALVLMGLGLGALVSGGRPALAQTNNVLHIVDNKVGIGTAAPLGTLHLETTGLNAVFLLNRTDGAQGKFTAQTGEVCIGSVSNHKVQFVANNNMVMTMTPDGKVGIGTVAPTRSLELSATGSNPCILISRTDGAQTYINANDTYGNVGTQINKPFRLMVNATWKVMLNIDGSLNMANGASCTAGGVWTNASSRELKENIAELEAGKAMQALAALKPVTFNYKVDKGDRHVGFIAEDAPELVAAKDRKGMSAMDVVAVLTKVVQEQQAEIGAQQAAIDAQKEEIAALRAQLTERLARLEAAVSATRPGSK